MVQTNCCAVLACTYLWAAGAKQYIDERIACRIATGDDHLHEGIYLLQKSLSYKKSPNRLGSDASIGEHGWHQIQQQQQQPIDVASSKPLAWVHIPKCGTSLQAFLLDLPGMCEPPYPDDLEGDMREGGHPNGPPRYPMKSSNCPGAFSTWWLHESVGGYYDEQYKGHGMIMLRQPEQRLLSAWKGSWGFNLNSTWAYPGFSSEEKSRISSNISLYTQYQQGCAVKVLARSAPKLQRFKTEMYPCNSLSLPTEEEVATAVQRLREGFIFVGLVDEWDLSICLGHAMFGGPCKARDFQNLNQGPSHEDTYDVAELDGFQDVYDGRLYEVGQEIFNKKKQEYGINIATCRPCFDNAAKDLHADLMHRLGSGEAATDVMTETRELYGPHLTQALQLLTRSENNL